MKSIRFFPDDTRFPFMGQRYIAFAFTAVLTIATVVSLAVQGLNLGSDFAGGIVIEARSSEPVELAEIRSTIAALGFPDATIQQFGDPHDVLIRVKPEGEGDRTSFAGVERIKNELGSQYEFLRTEFVGPQVSAELLRNGVTAAILAVLCIAIYVWFRFEWQFGVSALITTFHDVIATFGLFSIFQMTFDLTVVAAILTVAGYSINDTVVVFDRIRENRRLYKKMDLSALIDLSVNQTLARTVLTGTTTLLASLSLLLFGGPVLFNFAAGIIFGVIIGTYSSIFVASALMLHMRRLGASEEVSSGPQPPSGRGGGTPTSARSADALASGPPKRFGPSQ